MITKHDIAGGNLLDRAVAHHLHSRFHEDGQLVEVALGPQLLSQAKGSVDDGHAADGDGPLIFLKSE